LKETQNHFKNRLEEITLNNIQFVGDNDAQRDMVIFKFINILSSFKSLKVLSLKGLNNAPKVFKALGSFQNTLGFANSLRELEINACVLKMEDENGWLAEEGQVVPAHIYESLKDFILKFDNLEKLDLIGLGLVDHLHEMLMAVKRPKLKHLSLPLNGIEQEYCQYFNYMFNFETLESLNLSSNWFGQEGLKRFKDQFSKFTCLKSLNMSNNKLGYGAEVHEVRDCFAACGANLEELVIMENSWKD
jgi:Leucine-rich repeat (LRR) protein